MTADRSRFGLLHFGFARAGRFALQALVILLTHGAQLFVRDCESLDDTLERTLDLLDLLVQSLPLLHSRWRFAAESNSIVPRLDALWRWKAPQNHTGDRVGKARNVQHDVHLAAIFARSH